MVSHAAKPREHAETQCTGTAKTTGQRCRRVPEPGGVVCYKHGGRTPQVKSAAEVRRLDARNRSEALKRLQARMQAETPHDALAELERAATEAVVFKDVIYERLSMLSDDEWRYEGKTGEQTRAEITLYERALDRVLKFEGDLLKLGIAERRARIEEAELILVAGAIRATLNRIGLTAEQQRIATVVIQEELMGLHQKAISG